MPKRFLGLPRAAALAIVLIAAALMLLKPLCESWHGGAASRAPAFDGATLSMQASAHSDGSSADACCSSDDTGVASALRAVSFDRGGGSSSMVPPFVPAALVVLSLAAHAIVRRRPPARTPRSYYLRSARILR